MKQHVSILIKFTGNLSVLERKSKELGFQVTKVPESEMIDTYNLTVTQRAQAKAIARAIRVNPNVSLVGAYKKNGEVFTLDDAADNHTITKYKNRLGKFRRFAENGDLLEERDYTNAEAKNVQVNKIAGWADRQL